MTTDFRSDNTLGASPEILEAIARANHGSMTSYGGDEITARLRARCREIFETDLEVFPVVTGTAGNALAISAFAPKTVVCHEEAHIVRDENGAVEFFSGAKLRTVPGVHGKLQPPLDAECLSITNATEAGTIYSPDELRALIWTAAASPPLSKAAALPPHSKRVHIDGARFANALAAQNCSPAELSWRAGADILVLGATKNGGLTADLIVVFNRDIAAALAEQWHRGGHRPSKMRFLSAQL